MSIEKVLRSTRHARRTTSLPRRPDADLTFFKDLPVVGEAIMFDTCVYIDELHNRLPKDITTRIERRGISHSSLALSEIIFSFGRLDPNDPRTVKVTNKTKEYLSFIHDQRLFVPSSKAMMRGAVLAGSMSRILCYKEEQRLKGFNDAMIATHAIEKQLLLITRNISDFDRLSQLDNKLKVAFYRI